MWWILDNKKYLKNKMGEILPDDTIQGYQGYCPICKKVINTNIQGNELYPKHECIEVKTNVQLEQKRKNIAPYVWCLAKAGIRITKV
jgi:hypothetical protein